MSSDFHTSITRRPRVQGKRVIPPRYWIRRDNNSTGIFSPGKGEGKPWRSLSFGNLRMPRGFQFELIKGSDSRSPTKRNPPSSFSFFLSFFLVCIRFLYTLLIISLFDPRINVNCDTLFIKKLFVVEDCDKIQISCLPIFFDPSTRLKFLTTDEHALHAFDRFPLGFPTVDPRYFQIIRPASGIKWVWSGKS